MAATKKAATPKAAAPKKDDADEAKNEKQAAAPDEGDTPAGYLWVTRKKPVQLHANNPQWEKPSLIDAKSLPELEVQGYVVAPGPDADGPAK